MSLFLKSYNLFGLLWWDQTGFFRGVGRETGKMKEKVRFIVWISP